VQLVTGILSSEVKLPQREANCSPSAKGFYLHAPLCGTLIHGDKIISTFINMYSQQSILKSLYNKALLVCEATVWSRCR